MKFATLAVVGSALVLSTALAQDPKAAPKADANFKDLKSKASYAIGLSIGGNMKKQSIDLDPEFISKGIKDSLSGAKPLLTDDQIGEVLREFQTKAVAEVAEKAKAEGVAFLAKNKTAPGVKVTDSGLQYKVIKDGTGKTPTAKDEVTTHYRGTLINGTEFDSSYKRGEPATFPVGGVIKGWTEALQLMKVGSKWQLVIPSELAYGENPRPGGPIPPNAVLIFEIELLDVKPGQ